MSVSYTRQTILNPHHNLATVAFYFNKENREMVGARYVNIHYTSFYFNRERRDKVGSRKMKASYAFRTSSVLTHVLFGKTRKQSENMIPSYQDLDD